MFSYENGLLISFLLYLYQMITVLMTINSTAEKNLNKIGERHSWLTLKAKPMSKDDFNRPFYKSILRFLFIALWQGIFIFLSWVNIFLFVCLTVYKISQDYGAPREVKDFRWKIKNQNLTFDELIYEIIKLRGMDKESFEDVKGEMIQFINLRKES